VCIAASRPGLGRFNTIIDVTRKIYFPASISLRTIIIPQAHSMDCASGCQGGDIG
jgi:hypothetical protein